MLVSTYISKQMEEGVPNHLVDELSVLNRERYVFCFANIQDSA